MKDLLYLSEISAPVENPASFNADLKTSFGLEKYDRDEMFIGDEYGLFVVPPVGRFWIPERKLAASAHPIEVRVADKELSPYNSSKYPYIIKSS